MHEDHFDVSVLYVEDDAATREQIALFLGRRVRRFIPAENGEEGLRLFRTEGPDLVITDIRMPVMDGLQMARAIRALKRDVPIIVTTAHGDVSHLMGAIDAGIDQYVMKPVQSDRLLMAIEKCTEVIEYRRDAQQYLEERERLVRELQGALEKVKLLSGFLPICASCKKIRDDKGYWQRIEAYISEHSEAEFSHGICPDCARKIYPEFFKQ
ncbi:MAG: response regulator [Nitrospiraceae bacterium]|nr:response regulator [Nitrospiraceae bacterium]